MGQLVRGMRRLHKRPAMPGADENRTILRERFELRLSLKTPAMVWWNQGTPPCAVCCATMDASTPYFASNGPAPEVLGEVSSPPTLDGVLCAAAPLAEARIF